MNRKKLLIIAGIAVVILLIVVILLLNRKSEPEDLVATDLVAANMQFVDDLDQPGGDILRFYTGTALAEIKISEDEDTTSKLLSKDLALHQVKEVRESGSLLAVKAYYRGPDNLLTLADNSQPLPIGDEWFVFDHKDNNVRSLRQALGKATADVALDGGAVYALLDEGSGKTSLHKLNADLSRDETLATDLDATSIVGIVDGTLVMRDFKGKVYTFRAGGNPEVLAENVASAIIDKQTKRLVTSKQVEEEISEEGGNFTANASEQRLTIYDIGSDSSVEIVVLGSSFFVSSGYVLSVRTLNQPADLSYYNLGNQERGAVLIDQASSNVEDSIKSLIVLEDDLSSIAAVTNFNHLLLYQSPRITPPNPYRLPLIRDNLGRFGFNYDVGKNLAAIYYSGDTPNVIESSIADLASLCKCDVNQVGKQWDQFATDPGL